MNDPSNTTVVASPFDCLSGGGEMGELMRSFKWGDTPIGPVESWSPALRMMVRFLLANRFPLLLWWGPQYVSIYNDPYRPILGSKHPWALGKPVSECWQEIWHILKPLIDTPFHGGPPTWNDDIFLEINRHGYVEETHFTIAYSPVPDETEPSGIGGVLATVHEITEKVIAQRRVVALRDLGARLADAKTAEEACEVAARTLASHDKDIPFVLLYLLESDGAQPRDGAQARLAGAAGVPPGEDISPRVIDLRNSAATGWPFAEALESRALHLVPDLRALFNTLPAGPWADAPNTAVVATIPSNKAQEAAGLMIAGVSARLKFDEYYRDFMGLVRTHVATAIANARAYEEERKRAEALAELDRAKTAFFSNVSHEFRTPLTLMLGPLEEALGAGALGAEDRDRLEVAHRNSLRLLKLVNTLLDFSRIEAGRIQAAYEPVDLSALTAELAGVYRSAIENAGLQFAVICPPLTRDVYLDREMWEKIVLNLLSNAFKFTFTGKIEVTVRECPEMVEIAVADTGTGIPAEEIPNVFKRFHRVRSARGRTYEGSGIGLALVQELVKLHGGSVSVSSEIDRGSTFTVRIPFGSAHLPADRVAAPSTMAAAAAHRQTYLTEAAGWSRTVVGPAEVASAVAVEVTPEVAPEVAPEAAPEAALEVAHIADSPGLPASSVMPARILLVDDNADMRDYALRLLRKHYHVEAVSDGAEALNAARQRPPDLLLTDVMMPVLDGFGLLRELRSDERLKKIPVIILSARAGEESRVDGMAAGADDYLIKPFSARELLARVKTHLEMARTRREGEERLAAEAAALARLNDASSRLWRMRTLREGLDEMLGATIELLSADMGNVQLLDAERGVLVIATHRGFNAEFTEHFRKVNEEAESTCGRALRSRQRVVIEDIEADPLYASLLPIARATGFRAVQSTPLIGRNGRPLGMISTHFRQPHRPTEPELRRLDLYARQAADFIERCRLDSSLRAEEEKLLRREQEARLKAEEASRVKNEFLATVSHELRTPLTAILGWADMLGAGAVAVEKVPAAVETIRRNARAQRQLIDDLLDVSRIIAGKIRLNLRALNPALPIDAAIESLRPTADARRVTLERIIINDLGSISADGDRLQQIVWNLLSNAIKFTPPGGRVVLSCERQSAHRQPHDDAHSDVHLDAHLHIVVADTGRGIDPRFLPYVFDRFRQADSAITREQGGLGLGLAIVRHLAELHGGEVRAESAGEGMGATFTVTLPVFSPPQPDDASQPVALDTEVVPQEMESSDRLQGVRVLVVDDDPETCELVKLMLRRSGAEVAVANSGHAALKALEQSHFDLLVSDVGMPGADGYQLMQTIRALPSEQHRIPSIALTAYATTDDRLRALRAGYQTHIPKPIDCAELITVAESLATRR